MRSSFGAAVKCDLQFGGRKLFGDAHHLDGVAVDSPTSDATQQVPTAGLKANQDRLALSARYRAGSQRRHLSTLDGYLRLHPYPDRANAAVACPPPMRLPSALLPTPPPTCSAPRLDRPQSLGRIPGASFFVEGPLAPGCNSR